MKIYQVDSFTENPFGGNPAGVCIYENEMTEDFMQKISMEMNLSETAFLKIVNDEVHIRFFTPEKEVHLCGHATLASAFILYENGYFTEETDINFHSKGGLLKISKEKEYIKMIFPRYDLFKSDVTKIPDIFGVIPSESYNSSYNWKLLYFNDEEDIINLKLNFLTMKESGLGHLMVTAPSKRTDVDFVLRCFAPDLGINEDPVTGSSMCALIPFWYCKTGKKTFNSLQLSKRRGSLKCTYENNEVIIMGKAVEIFEIELKI